MASTVEKKLVTADEYLRWERNAQHKSEFHNGEVYALAGASFVHNQIARNNLVYLGSFLKGKSCDIFPSDLRLNIPDYNVFAYPDLMIICGKPDFTDGHTDTITNPTVIFEVLSSSTADYDRGTKFMYYRSIPSLKQYVMIETALPKVVLHRKNEESHWELTDLEDVNGVVEIPVIEYQLPFSEIYRQVSFDSK